MAILKALMETTIYSWILFLVIEQILFAIRHELTHYRRRDYLVSLILRILEAVYWFNPIVWIASNRILLDIEIGDIDEYEGCPLRGSPLLGASMNLPQL